MARHDDTPHDPLPQLVADLDQLASEVALIAAPMANLHAALIEEGVDPVHGAVMAAVYFRGVQADPQEAGG